ncbi:MAG: glycerate kinase [Sphingomonas bacterium]|uniref:glycerate kinase type-2 family protein n=1 Tax=Sphingomonas bacterium TaxID=1895847 RepID=UPI0026060452|nr:glycerate kinase [Sphingomonas bacterium]MDB5705988.1 glycerate kinase [Sphingomonas bacterium]
MTPPAESRMPPRVLLRALFDAGVDAVRAERAIPPAMTRETTAGRTLIVAIGKAAAAMASIAAKHVSGPLSGLVITRQGHAGPPHVLPADFEVIEAGHPVPDGESIAAATRALELVRALGAKDRLLTLVSGGGSALFAMPVPGVSLEDKQVMTQALLRSGATIAEINSVRKHLSLVKGGRLAVAAAPAHVTTLIISDVPGDDPSFVASGPTVADHTTLEMAREILERYGIAAPANVMAALNSNDNETPPSDALGLAGGDVRNIACAQCALTAARTLAEEQGYKVTDLGDHLQAEAKHLGAGHAALARRLAADGVARVILSGGETTVRVTNPDGRGGRNLEYLLGLALALDGAPRIHAIACDTDGIDGTEDNAGAIVTPDTLARARDLGLDARAMLCANRAYDFFQALGDLVVTGPTRTNVNDLRAILIEPEEV